MNKNFNWTTFQKTKILNLLCRCKTQITFSTRIPQVSGVMCNFFLGGGQSCEACRWRVCYQRGLSCLVYVRLDDWFLFSHQWKHFLEVMFKFLWRIILNFLNRVLKIGYHIFAPSRQKEIFITECQSSREKRLSGAIIP